MFIFKLFQPQVRSGGNMLTCPIMGSWPLLKTSFRKPLGLKAIKDSRREMLFPGVVSDLNGYTTFGTILHCRNNSSLYFILSQMNPINLDNLCYCKDHFSIVIWRLIAGISDLQTISIARKRLANTFSRQPKHASTTIIPGPSLGNSSFNTSSTMEEFKKRCLYAVSTRVINRGHQMSRQ
jgi:hypothetical protein